MTRPFTVQVGYNAHYCNTLTVEAETLEEALENAIAAANNDADGWRSTDHVSDSFVDAVCEGAGADPWSDDPLPVPGRYSEHGGPPLVTLTGPVPPGAVEVSGGRVMVRIAHERGTVTSEICDPPHPAANKPLVTVRRRPDGAPEVEVTGGSAKVRILDE